MTDLATSTQRAIQFPRAASVTPLSEAQSEHEAARLACVETYGVLDTVPEPAFERITALAADLFQAPIAIIGFIGGDQVFFKSHHGLPATQASRGRDASLPVLAAWIRGEFRFGFHAEVPLDSPDGHQIGTLCVIDRRPRRIEETQMRRLRVLGDVVKDELAMRLAARRALVLADIMKSEVDHRVMNSLQFVSSLLQLQGRNAPSSATSQQLMAAAMRVAAVARVHRAFSVDEVSERVSIVAHLHKLCAELSAILACEVNVGGARHMSVPKTQVLAIGLIVNELVTNARKHGAGPITVTFASGPGIMHEIRVLDEGRGLPPGFEIDAASRDGLGMKVVKALVEQLGGRLAAHANPAGRGACITVAFPAE